MASGVNFGTQQYFGFDPRTIPECALWFDAADTTTITTTGTTQVTGWTNKGSIVTTAAPTAGTSTTGNTFNGLNYINIPVGAEMRFTAAINTQARSWFFVARCTTAFTANPQFWGPVNATANGRDGLVVYSDTSIFLLYNGPNGIDVNVSGYIGNPFNRVGIYALVNSATAALNLVTDNGTSVALANSVAAGSFNTGSAQVIIGTAGYAKGNDIMEIILYYGDVTQSQRQQVEGYLARKWGLAANLPTNHPYKNVSPIMRNFQPVDLEGGTLLWLDAADTRTITGSPVTQWTDKSGRGSNATTGTGSVVAGTAINSLNTLRFGFDIRLYLSNFVMPSSQTSVFYVFRGVTQNTGGGGTGYFIFSRTTDNFLVFSGNEQFAAYQNVPAGRSYLAIIGPGGERNWGNLSTTAFFNAVNVISTTGVSYASSNGLSLPLVRTDPLSNTVFTATTYQIGTTRNCCGDVFTYDLGELVVCDGTVSIPAAQQMEGYLAWKWGVQRSLPTTHPYYNVLPSTALFVPTSFTNCALWFDAADRTSFVLSGSSVTTWNDKSGNGRNAVNQNTAGVLVDSVQNQLSVLRLAGVNNYAITYPSFPNAAYTVFTVQYLSTTTGYGRLLQNDNNPTGSAPGLFIGVGPDGTSIATFTGPGSGWNDIDANSPGRSNLTTWRIVTTWVSGSTLTPYVDGTAQTNKVGTTRAFSNLNIGSYPNSPPVQAWNGDVGEIILYSSALTTAQRQRVEGYLAWKWGLRLSLPSTHPYSNFRP
jgi:hypothetical protein